MDKIDVLLTDEFVAFSEKIKDILDRKKAKKLELKTFYEKIQVDLKSLDDEATAAKTEFEAKSKSVEGESDA